MVCLAAIADEGVVLAKEPLRQVSEPRLVGWTELAEAVPARDGFPVLEPEGSAEIQEVRMLGLGRQGVAGPFPDLVQVGRDRHSARHQVQRPGGIAPLAEPVSQDEMRAIALSRVLGVEDVEEVPRLDRIDLHRRGRGEEHAARSRREISRRKASRLFGSGFSASRPVAARLVRRARWASSTITQS